MAASHTTRSLFPPSTAPAFHSFVAQPFPAVRRFPLRPPHKQQAGIPQSPPLFSTPIASLFLHASFIPLLSAALLHRCRILGRTQFALGEFSRYETPPFRPHRMAGQRNRIRHVGHGWLDGLPK